MAVCQAWGRGKSILILQALAGNVLSGIKRIARVRQKSSGIAYFLRGESVMMKCNWPKWIFPWAILPLGLGAAALLFNSDSLENKLKTAAESQLASGGAGWASVMMDGRDAKLSGEAPEQDAIASAARLVAGTYGVRRVDSSGVTVTPPVSLSAPTVNKVSGVATQPEITGTWDEAKATTLAVTLAGTAYTLGKSPELTSDGAGNWKLVPSQALSPGNYDVTVETTDGKKASQSATVSGAVSVEEPPAPAAPAVPVVSSAASAGFEGQPVAVGTWSAGSGETLEVAAAGKTYKLGTDSELTSPSSGNWRLEVPGLDDGTYDVTATVTKDNGQSSSATGTAAMVVRTPAPGEPTINRVSGFGSMPEITGSWPNAAGNSLSVALAGKDYKLGTDPELTSTDGGIWTLKPSSALADGTYDVVASVTNAGGKSSSATLNGAISVDTTPPPAPTVNKLSTRSVRPAITGTWPEGEASAFKVELAGQTYELGKNEELTSDGNGNWTLKVDTDLADNTYDVVATAMDEAGNSASDRGFGELVVDASAPAVPSVNTILTRQRQPVLTGAWPSKDAAKLTVSVGDKTYVAGAGDGLSTDGDNWTLRIGDNLADGTYNVVATVTDQAGNSATDESDAELVVDATPPAVPTVNSYKAKHPRPLLSGTFPENEADTLAVTFAGETFAKGSSDLLSTDGRGNWSILTQKDYEPGTYDVKVVVADKAGNQRSDNTTGEVVIEAPPAPAPAPAPAEASVNCQKLFDDLLAGGKDVEFATARATIRASSTALLDALADVIKQCPDAKIEIGGHTDASGSTSYNQALSERRAVAVRDALIERGANAGNLTAVGYGESRPIADNGTREGRARNRRTEFKVQP
jgi:outer membrane protein OmpA-like peptidoglycan-associated protein